MLDIWIKNIKNAIEKTREEAREEAQRKEEGKIPVEIEFRIFLKNGDLIGPLVYQWEHLESGMFFITSEERAESGKDHLLAEWGSKGIEYEGFFYPHSMIERIEPRPPKKVYNETDSS